LERVGGRDEERGDGKRTHISINNIIINPIKELDFNLITG
jgi:hypothetical protein